MWINLVALLVNFVLLALTLASRMALHGGSAEIALGSLPWQSFGTELGELLWAETVSSAALTTGWLCLTLGWGMLTMAQVLISRQRQSRKPLPKASRPEPGFMAAQSIPEPVPVNTESLVAQAPAPSMTAHPLPNNTVPLSDTEVDQQIAALRRRSANLSPEAKLELERLQSALSQLQKT